MKSDIKAGIFIVLVVISFQLAYIASDLNKIVGMMKSGQAQQTTSQK